MLMAERISVGVQSGHCRAAAQQNGDVLDIGCIFHHPVAGRATGAAMPARMSVPGAVMFS